MWKCLCDCGKEKDVPSHNLIIGKTKSCGCLNLELASARATTHGATKNGGRDRLYKIWAAMKERCYREKDTNYKNYGARGITVCKEWRNSYSAFREWALGHGYIEDAEYGECTLDRIDVDGDYCPENCRWISKLKQANNKRNNHFLTYGGETLTVAEWARRTGIHCNRIYTRINKFGWPIEKALTTPVRKIRRGGGD